MVVLEADRPPGVGEELGVDREVHHGRGHVGVVVVACVVSGRPAHQGGVGGREEGGAGVGGVRVGVEGHAHQRVWKAEKECVELVKDGAGERRWFLSLFGKVVKLGCGGDDYALHEKNRLHDSGRTGDIKS